VLVGVSPFDPLTCAAVSRLLFAVCPIAPWVPARCASSLDPLIAQRTEQRALTC